MFKSMLIEKTNFLVSHANIVSFYDMIKNIWIKHIEFGGQVKAVLKKCNPNAYRPNDG